MPLKGAQVFIGAYRYLAHSDLIVLLYTRIPQSSGELQSVPSQLKADIFLLWLSLTTNGLQSDSHWEGVPTGKVSH